MSETRGAAAPNRPIGRFTLTDLVDERYGCQVWKAADSTLNREVVLWLIPNTDALAADLGFAEPSAFHRAFRKWHDASPAAWRRQIAREGAPR